MFGNDSERYLVVFDGEKFEVIEDYDMRENDIPMCNPTMNWAEVKALKLALEIASKYRYDLVEKMRVDMVADAIN